MPSPFDVQTSLKYVFSFKSTKWKREIIFKIFVSNKIISLLYNTTKFIWWGPFQQNKKQYQSTLDGVTKNVSEPTGLRHFPSFWSKKLLALPFNGFPIPPFNVHLLGLPPQTTITYRRGGRCRFFMRVFSVWICKRAFSSGIEPHAANHKSPKWDACRLFMRIERRFDQVMFDWITSKLSERNKNLN